MRLAIRDAWQLDIKLSADIWPSGRALIRAAWPARTWPSRQTHPDDEPSKPVRASKVQNGPSDGDRWTHHGWMWSAGMIKSRHASQWVSNVAIDTDRSSGRWVFTGGQQTVLQVLTTKLNNQQTSQPRRHTVDEMYAAAAEVHLDSL